MGFLRGPHNSNYVPRYTGLQIQTSSNAVPIALVYGTNKISTNAIWTGGFFAVANYQSGGGKGGGRQVSGYTYYTSFAMGLCEGPINNYGAVWTGQSRLPSLYGSGLVQATGGSTPQTPWGFLSTYYPAQALGYNGLAYVGATNFQLGSSPTLPQFAFEIHGINAIWSGNVVNAQDSDPALIVQDFLTNAQYGVGFPAASIDATTLLGSSGGSSYQTYCRALGLALSPALINQEAANSILSKWLQLTNTASVWSGGKLKFIPYGDTSVAGQTSIGTVTFNPNVTPVYDLADDDFIREDGADPLQIERSDPFASFNWQRLHISQRSNYYNATPIEAFDQNAIELYGRRPASDITANEICDEKVGQTAAQLILQRQLYIRNTYKFKLSFEYCLMEPMDLATVTDAGLGLDHVAVRIKDIEEDDSGVLAVTAEEFPGGVAHSAQYPVQTGGGNSTDQGVVPARVNPPVIFEPPPLLSAPASGTGTGTAIGTPPQGASQVWIAVSGGIATAYKLAEDGSAGLHYAFQIMNASQTIGTSITFSVYVQAVERSAVRLQIFDGTTFKGCDFNLATGTAGTASAGITSVFITPIGGGWFQCAISCPMAANANPVVYALLENPYSTISYTGTAGDGILIWGAEFSAGDEALTFLPPFSATTNATLATSGAATPEGVAGHADPNWGGAFVWLSADGTTYGRIGQVSAPARQGTLTATFAAPSGGNPDTTNTLSVDLTESGGTLANATNLDAQNGVTLCLVDNELLAYGSAALTGPNSYNLTYLYRGLYGTTAVSHSIGAPFVRADGAVFQYTLPPSYVGVLLYLKFQSFNIFGQAVEDLAECTVYTYTPTGAGQQLGPVAQALSIGSNLDYGLASAGVNESDDFGLASTAIIATIDMGLVSS